MRKFKLTQEDLDNNPALVEQGLKVGDEIEIPDEQTGDANESDGLSDDTGGSNPPPDKPRD